MERWMKWMRVADRSMAGWAVLLIAVSVLAEEPATISVTGTGEAKGKPSVAEIVTTVNGEAELAADAIVKFQDARRRALEAMEALALENLSVEGQGVAINSAGVNPQMAMMMGRQPGADVKPKIEVSEQLRLTLTGIDKLKVGDLVETLVKVIDAGKDAGLKIGGGPLNIMQMQMRQGQAMSLALFKLADVKSLREQAYKLAMEDARLRAERLAELAGVKLAGVRSVQESAFPVDTKSPNAWMRMIYGMAGKEEDKSASPVLKDIPVRVQLSVVFDIEK